jgi:hypothetical protein
MGKSGEKGLLDPGRRSKLHVLGHEKPQKAFFVVTFKKKKK